MDKEPNPINFETFEFAGFRLDTSKNLLSQYGEPIKLKAKAVELLIFLVRNNGRVVRKDEILEAVWPNSFVEEANLTVHISALRKVLANGNGHQNPHEKVTIDTFPKVGYRFVGDVKRSRGEQIRDAASEPPAADGVTPAPPQQRRSRTLIYIVGAVLLLAPVYVGFRWLSPFSSTPSISRLNGFEGVSSFAVSPDGNYAAQVIRRDGKAGVAMVHLRSNSRIQLVEPAEFGFHGLKFSRDGNYLYFTRTSPNESATLFRTPILSPEPVKLVSNVAIHVGVAPTDDRICFIRQSGKQKTDLMVANTDGTGERVLASREGEETYWSWSIDWSPDGRRIATSVRRTGQNSNTRLVTVNVETGEEAPITGPVFGSGGGEGLVWLADGSGIIYSGGDLVETRAQLWHVEYPSGYIRKLTNDVESYGYPSISQDGQIMAAQFDDTNAIWVDPAPFDTAKPLTSPFKHNLNWARSNSLGQIVFGSSARGTRDIWLVNADGSGERQLTQNSGSNIMPVLSEDGSFLVFSSNRVDKEKYNLWRMNLDGSELKQLTFGDGEVQPAISPDGQWVYYATGGISGGHGERTLWRVASGGGEPQKLVDGIAHGADVSPDGKAFAAWYKPQDSGWKLAIFKAEGGPPLKMFDADMGVPVKWTADGKAVAYMKVVNGVSNIWKQPVDGGDPVKVTGYTTMRTLNFDWSADDRIVCVRNERTTNVVLVKNFR